MPSARSYRPPDDAAWVEVGRMLHAPDGCDVAIGSPEEAAVRMWANGIGERTWVCLRTERRMRELLRARGWMAEARVVRELEEDGGVWSRLEEGCGDA